MKNFKLFLVAAVALIAGMAITSCTPDDPIGGGKKETKAEVTVGDLTPNGATLTVVTNNIKEFAYLVDPANESIPTSAILQAGEKTTIETTDVEQTTKITLQGYEASSAHKVFLAFRQADGAIYKEKVVVEFTTTSYGDNVLTVVERKYDGFAIHVQFPEEVALRGNGLRYSTSSLAMYNYMTKMGNLSPDQLLYNAGQCITKDKTIRYDEENSYERNEDGTLVEDGASFADPKVPGEPGVFIIGEYEYMDDPDELVVYMDIDGDGTKEVKKVSVPESDPEYMNYAGNAIWWYPAGWKAGYYNPVYDWEKYIADTQAGTMENSEDYWNGYFEKMYISTLDPETLDANIDIKVSELTPIDAHIEFTPSDNIAQYCILMVTESEYQNDILPLIDNNEEYLRWFTGSYFAMRSFGIEMAQGYADLYLTDWYVDTKEMAGQTVRILVTGIGDQDGKLQYFTTKTFTLPEKTLPKPEVIVTPVTTNDPYNVTFNIKNPNYGTNDITEAKFACNYVREYDAILKQYSYTDLLKQMGNPLDKTALEGINSAAGFNFTISSRDAATTRLAVLAYNWEGSCNNPDAIDTQAVAENTTANANYPVRVNSDFFTKVPGEWTAQAPMKRYVAVTDNEGNSTGEFKVENAGTYTSDVTISGGLEYPAVLPEEIYAIYTKAGLSREATTELYEQFKAEAEKYNTRTRGFNRLLCLGYNFADADYMLSYTATPYELFYAEDYSVSQVSYMFYDFGPKWNLEIDADGNVWLPINIEREYPLETFNFGLDYAFYMLAVGESSYLGAPVYGYDGKLVLDSRFPVEVSDDWNTITIKPIIYNYTDSNGNPAIETYYPCVAQLQYGMATPLNPRVCGDVVLTRKGASTQAASFNAPVGTAPAQPVKSLGKAPVPMTRAYSMTAMDASMMKPVQHIVREEKIELGGFRKRANELVFKTYGIRIEE